MIPRSNVPAGNLSVEFEGRASHEAAKAAASPVEPSPNPHHSGRRVGVKPLDVNNTFPVPVSVKCLLRTPSNCEKVIVTPLAILNTVSWPANAATVDGKFMLVETEKVAAPKFTKIGRVSPANISDVMVPSMPVQSRVPPVDGRSALAAAILSPAVTPLKPL